MITTPSKNEQGTLVFFRNQPKSTDERLVSSLQSFETSFFLIALGRYPHALTTFVSGIESALQAAGLGSKDNRLVVMLKEARSKSGRIRELPTGQLDCLRESRNRIVHRGFTPKDDSEAVGLLLDVALPLAEASYRDLHDFDLSNGLLQEYAHLLEVARLVLKRAHGMYGLDISYSLNPFGHLIRSGFQHEFSTTWQMTALTQSEEIGLRSDQAAREKNELDRLFDASCVVACPICHESDGAVCELDTNALHSRTVIPKRMACTNCGFVVLDSQPFLTEVLVERQLEPLRELILKEYGIK